MHTHGIFPQGTDQDVTNLVQKVCRLRGCNCGVYVTVHRCEECAEPVAFEVEHHPRCRVSLRRAARWN